MLWTISVVLVILWLLGFVSGYTVDHFIHIPLFFAIIAILFQVEEDCSDFALAGEGEVFGKEAYQRNRSHSKSLKGDALPVKNKEAWRI